MTFTAAKAVAARGLLHRLGPAGRPIPQARAAAQRVDPVRPGQARLRRGGWIRGAGGSGGRLPAGTHVLPGSPLPSPWPLPVTYGRSMAP